MRTKVGCKVRYRGDDYTFVHVDGPEWTLEDEHGKRIIAAYDRCQPYRNDPRSCHKVKP